MRRPPTPWLLFVVVLAVLGVALLLEGLVTHEIGPASTASSGTPVRGLASAGPVMDLSGPQVRSAPVPTGEIALTFDDGPDRRWTPAILAVLSRYHVPATFFVVGSNAARHPGLIRRMLRSGDEVGSHTFTHANLASVSGVRADFELALTQTALAGAVGRNSPLLRLPYTASAAGFTADTFRAARAASRFGYLIVASTNDSQDWRKPTPQEIVLRSSPSGGAGGIVLLHDGGGDRSRTVAALDLLIPKLQASGYHFVTVSQFAGLPRGTADPRVGTVAHLQGVGLLGALRIARLASVVLGLLLVPIGLLAALRGLICLGFARRHARRDRLGLAVALGRAEAGSFHPAVSVVVPAYNEEVGIGAAVASLAASDYPELEVIVVDDGSTDRTAEVVSAMTDPRVRLVTQANAGKPAALNRGVAAATHDIIVMVDGDTVFEPDTITNLVRQLADPSVGAVSGNTKVGNRGGLLGRWQHAEYVIGFNLDRRMYDSLRCMPTVPGAIGAFRRSALDSIGGVSDDTLAEDTDLTMALHRAGWRVVYEQRARAWTEAPASLTALWQQRYRWCYGTMQAMWKHRGAIRERSALGLLGLPYLFAFQVLLPLLAPAIDLYAVYGLVFLNPLPIAAFWIAFNLLQLGLGMYAFRLDREPLRPLWALPLQQLVYRQLMYLVVIQSVISAATGARLRWHKLLRTGDIQIAETTRS